MARYAPASRWPAALLGAGVVPALPVAEVGLTLALVVMPPLLAGFATVEGACGLDGEEEDSPFAVVPALLLVLVLVTCWVLPVGEGLPLPEPPCVELAWLLPCVGLPEALVVMDETLEGRGVAWVDFLLV